MPANTQTLMGTVLCIPSTTALFCHKPSPLPFSEQVKIILGVRKCILFKSPFYLLPSNLVLFSLNRTSLAYFHPFAFPHFLTRWHRGPCCGLSLAVWRLSFVSLVLLSVTFNVQLQVVSPVNLGPLWCSVTV